MALPRRTLSGVEHAARRLARSAEPVVLAVSGGLDSMTLLEVAALHAARRVAMVATFDHGTGAAATRASALAARRAGELGFPVVAGCADRLCSTEAEWRAMRWEFLRSAAASAAPGAVIATAHTRDDHLETIVMRVMRDAGARGIACLYAEGSVCRPFLEVTRSELAGWAAEHGVAWVDDPSNASTRYLRNRVRRDLLPAIRRVRPGFDAEMLALARRAATWREDMNALAATLPQRLTPDGSLSISRSPLTAFDEPSLAALWPALAARVGVRLDRRGTQRLAAFTIQGARGSSVQVAGGWEVVMAADELVLRRMMAAPSRVALAAGDSLAFGRWTLHPVPEADLGDPWTATIPVGDVVVRPWQPGDRMRAAGAAKARRVKRFFGDARIGRAERAGWPVVVAGEEIVWIPGVRRSDAATVRPGRPGRPYRCDRTDR